MAGGIVRVVKTMHVGSKTEESVIWEGSDTIALSKQYPPSEIFGADELGHNEIEGGHIRWDHHFEEMTHWDGVNSEWVKIVDPRKRITPMTATERAIDAENRRDFPGDYMTADDEDE